VHAANEASSERDETLADMGRSPLLLVQPATMRIVLNYRFLPLALLVATIASSCDSKPIVVTPVRHGQNCGIAGRPETLGGCEVRSSTHADCGGSGAPVFGCDLYSDLDPIGCRWFATDCVPAKFEASACPNEALCCKGGTPYEGTITGGPLGTRSFLSTYGTTPIPIDWNVSLSVAIDSTVTPATTPMLTCVGHDCGAPTFVSRAGRGTFTVETQLAGVDLHLFVIDIVESGSGLAGRICEVTLSNDDDGFACPNNPSPRAYCALSGTITIVEDPFGVAGGSVIPMSVSAEFPTYTATIDL